MIRDRVYQLAPAVSALLVLALVGCGADDETTPPASAEATSTPKPTGGVKQFDAPPPMTIDPGKSYTATMKLESGGEVVIELFDTDAPKTVNNFVFLARQGYFDGITFHRVIPGFMAQTGDPTGTGRGGPGYTIEDEFSPNLRHDVPGILSMANKGTPKSGGSQFFITFVPTPHLDGKHSVFGKVVAGMDVVNKITVRDPNTATSPGDKIETIEIEER